MSKNEFQTKHFERELRAKRAALADAVEAFNTALRAGESRVALAILYERVDGLWVEVKTMLNIQEKWGTQ